MHGDFVEPQTGALPKFGRLRDGRVAQAVTRDMEADLLPELADDAEDGAGLEGTVAVLPANTTAQRLAFVSPPGLNGCPLKSHPSSPFTVVTSNP